MEQKEIKEGFEAMAKGLREFTKEEIAFFQGQGASIDVQSHTKHCEKVYMMGMIHSLQRRVEQLEGGKNVTRKKTTAKKSTTKTAARSGSKKRVSRKRTTGTKNNKRAGGQLELGV